jgi:hypothetical protein
MTERSFFELLGCDTFWIPIISTLSAPFLGASFMVERFHFLMAPLRDDEFFQMLGDA